MALTAYAVKEDEEHALAAGCDGYMTKPIDTRTFASVESRFQSSLFESQLFNCGAPGNRADARSGPAPRAACVKRAQALVPTHA